MTLGSHLILNGDTTVPTTDNRPGVGRRGMLRFNNDNNSAEIFDGANWADVGYYAGLPLGVIIAYPSDTPPNDTFLKCNGASLPRATYTDLFNLINTIYGRGSDTIGTTTFALPDIQGRTIVGRGAAGTFTTLNQTGGTETVKLDITQIPAHDHSVASIGVTGTVQFTGTAQNAQTGFGGSHNHGGTASEPLPGHSHTYSYETTQYDSGAGTNWQGYRVYPQQVGHTTGQARVTVQIGTDGSHNHTVQTTPSGSIAHSLTTLSQATSGPRGGDGTHNNLQPYIVLNYYIKATKESKRYASALVSDVRVKYNVRDMDSKEAMNAILSLQPKRYEYVDKTISDFDKHVGFIAQETKYCIPESVRTKRDFIPNVYSMAKITVHETSSILLTSVQKPITCIIVDELKEQGSESKQTYSIKGVKLKLFNRAKQPVCVTCIESIDDYNIVVESCTNQCTLASDDYFVYGQEVEDYHYMNNDAIFSTMVSAFQELEKRVKHQDILIQEIKKQMNIRL
jgi:microcystin-dependent protein